MSVSRIALFTLFLSMFSWVPFLTVDAPACTGMRVVAKDGSVAWARSLEFGSDIGSALMVAPRGMQWVSDAPDKAKGLSWTAKHAFFGPTAWGLPLPIEGMNEKGLYVGGFWMTEGESKFPDVKPADYPHTVAQMYFIPWVLTNFTTVDEVKAALPGITIAGLPVAALHTVPLSHWYIMDATGKAAVVESIDGKVAISDNPVGVFTNAPSFAWHLTNLRQYMNLSPDNVKSAKLGEYAVRPLGEGTGMLGLPGDFTPPSRFVRAAILSNTALQPDDADGAVNLGMNLIAGFAIAKGVTRGVGADGKPEYDYTQWTTVYDLARKAMYVRTYENQNYRLLRFDKLSLDGDNVLTIPMDKRFGPYEDISGQAR
ncbi:choloylglycine hydrolase family protein [uncultured Pseudodesulfovibrio sp.]|uniref:choloylglycine hydrolase family protein n=1 Tax=uncultured Pseudodesulfovibrio sp. TaxID=2035858 RepID=UPI0029C73E67|nr:choloylglycine hydrolase family protein [uncultured Pseudodesulfovibrio sp.]